MAMMKNEEVKWGAGLFVPEDKIIFEQEVGSGKYGRVFKAHVYGTRLPLRRADARRRLASIPVVTLSLRDTWPDPRRARLRCHLWAPSFPSSMRFLILRCDIRPLPPVIAVRVTSHLFAQAQRSL